MDSSHPKSPEFSLADSSPPHFSYDFGSDPSASPTGPTFDAFSAYSGGFDTSPRLGAFGSLGLGSTHTSPPTPFFTHHSHSHPSFPGASPTAHSFTSASTTSAGRPFTPIEGTDLTTISPPLTVGAHPHHHHHPYTATGVSGSELDEATARAAGGDGRRSSTNSPPSSASASASHPHSYNTTRGGSSTGASARYNPLAGVRPARPVRKAARRGVRRDEDDLSDEDGDVMAEEPIELTGGMSSSDIIQRRREEIRRQRIESEQRRRDELRDGYAKLKYALPISNQKSSKVSLLDRAVTYIRQLETSQGSLQGRLDNAEAELTRLRNVNEQLMRNLADQHRAVTLSALAAANAQATASANISSSTSSQTASEPPSPPAAALQQHKKPSKNKSPSF